jgi:hypothetical protein
MREYRRRRRYGVLSIRIRLALAYIDTLIERRHLKPEHRNDPEEIAIAVGDFIADTLTTRKGQPVWLVVTLSRVKLVTEWRRNASVFRRFGVLFSLAKMEERANADETFVRPRR